ncbi:DegV family protein [Motilibacter aurantiacus]|uniref:DegV family protein n=1 Tax=Motilibacter aurantiacus TaxID=2714955 RepID=UPI002F2B4A25
MTDSTACLPGDLVSDAGVVVVPLHVVVDGREALEPEVAPGEVADALRRRAPVTTSSPSPRAFRAAYAAAERAGASAVLSVHLSSSWSGTYEAARIAAREASLDVRVLDARTLGMAMGYAVLSAAEAAAGGAGLDVVETAARKRVERAGLWFMVPTLEHLRRGGRIGAAQALLGSALSIKPLLRVADGQVEPLEKVRTRPRAIERMVAAAAGHAGRDQVDVAVHHLGDREGAQELADRLPGLLPGLRRLVVAEVGAVIGAHVGPGVLGIVVAPA